MLSGVAALYNQDWCGCRFFFTGSGIAQGGLGISVFWKSCASGALGPSWGMTDWESRYQTGDMPWEKGRAAPPLLELLDRRGPEIWGKGEVLVPGCGLGHDVRALAACGVGARGVDLAATAVDLARGFPQVAGEAYELGDFLEPGWREGRQFSAIWEHTCFCAIDPSRRVDYAAAVADLLAEGGLLAGVFFLTPYDPGEESAGPPFPTSVDEITQLFAPWFECEDSWVPEQGYPGRLGREWVGLFRRKAQG